MGATIQVNDTTAFVYENGELIPVDDANRLEEQKNKERRAFTLKELDPDEYWQLLPDAIYEQDFYMFQTMRAHVLEQVQRYCLLRSEQEKTTTYSAASKEQTYKDMAKEIGASQLLDRMISGRELLPVAPPKSYFHNWYELVDNGEAVCIDVNTIVTKKWVDGKQTDSETIRIDGEEWKLLEKVVDENDSTAYIVKWKDTDYIFKLSRMTGDDFERLLHPRQRKLVKRDEYSWKLTRMENDDK